MVTFYTINKETGAPEVPVLFLDTLKVSTIEQTAEQAEARGGKGNPPLIIWDFGKEINVTLEDALFSAKSLAVMFGNGSINMDPSSDAITKTDILRTISVPAEWKKDSTTVNTLKAQINGVEILLDATADPKFYKADGTKIAVSGGSANLTDAEFCTFKVPVKDKMVIEISAATFPGTYYVTGDTYARSEVSGEDEFFQFIIPKAKVVSENTITLEAEGDPSVFNMSLRVMRPKDDKMMKLVKYNLDVVQG